MKRYRTSMLCGAIKAGQLLKVLGPCRLSHQISRCLGSTMFELDQAQYRSLQASLGALG